MKDSILLGLVGVNGSGKSSVCDYLKQKNYSVISLSDIVREEAKGLGLAFDRDSLTATGNKLKEKFGDDILARRAFDRRTQPNTVFDSIRNVAEVDYLRERGVKLVGIDAPMELRYERIQARQKTTDNVDFETFKKQCEREYTGESSGQNIKEALEHCNIVINNDGTMQALYAKIDALL